MTYDAPDTRWDIGQLLSESWSRFTGNAGLLIGASVLAMVVLVFASMFTWGILSYVIYGPLMYGLSLLSLKIARNRPADFNDLFAGFQHFVPAFLAGLLITIGTTIGFFLCLLPGVFLTIVWMLTFFYMADRNLDFWPAMEASRLKIMANFGQWFILWLVILVINILGSIPCGLGLLITAPISLLLLALAYDRSEGGASIDVDPVEPAM